MATTLANAKAAYLLAMCRAYTGTVLEINKQIIKRVYYATMGTTNVRKFGLTHNDDFTHAEWDTNSYHMTVDALGDEHYRYVVTWKKDGHVSIDREFCNRNMDVKQFG